MLIQAKDSPVKCLFGSRRVFTAEVQQRITSCRRREPNHTPHHDDVITTFMTVFDFTFKCRQCRFDNG